MVLTFSRYLLTMRHGLRFLFDVMPSIDQILGGGFGWRGAVPGGDPFGGRAGGHEAARALGKGATGGTRKTPAGRGTVEEALPEN